MYLRKENAELCATNFTKKLGRTMKDDLPNHGEEVTDATIGYAVFLFREYLGSCGRFLTNLRLAQREA